MIGWLIGTIIFWFGRIKFRELEHFNHHLFCPLFVIDVTQPPRVKNPMRSTPLTQTIPKSGIVWALLMQTRFYYYIIYYSYHYCYIFPRSYLLDGLLFRHVGEIGEQQVVPIVNGSRVRVVEAVFCGNMLIMSQHGHVVNVQVVPRHLGGKISFHLLFRVPIIGIKQVPIVHVRAKLLQKLVVRHIRKWDVAIDEAISVTGNRRSEHDNVSGISNLVE